MSIFSHVRTSVWHLAALATAVWFSLCAGADIVTHPDANTLWVEDVDPFERSADSRDGWFAFEPEEIAVEAMDGRVRFREISPYAGGSIQRILPLGGAAYPYLQVRVLKVENPSHFFKAWLRLPGHSHPQLGRLPEGLCTIDLSVFPFLEDLAEMPLNLAVIGPGGRTPSGFVELDWLRLVASPVGGLTMTLVDEGEANRVAEIGDTIVFTYTAEEPAEGPIEVSCTQAGDGEPLRLDHRDRVSLHDDGLDGDAEAGDGIYSARLVISPDATEFSGKSGSLLATAVVAGVPRHTAALFDIKILPAGWRAARAAQNVDAGELLFTETFSESDAASWRAYDDGWEVFRPDPGEDGNAGLRALTYDRPAPHGRWIALPAGPRRDTRLEADLRPLGGSGSMMLALRFQNPKNHYRLRVEGRSTVLIERVRAGWQEVLAETALGTPVSGGAGKAPTRVTFTAAGSLLLAGIGGEPVLHAYDTTFTDGRAALGLNRINAQFEDVSLRSAAAEVPPERFPWSGVRVQIEMDGHDLSFGRHAGAVRVPLRVENRGTRDLPALSVETSLIWRSLYTYPLASLDLPAVPSSGDARTVLRLAANRFRSGDYWLVARLRSGDEVVATDAVALTIGKPVPEERMEVLWWGGANLYDQVDAVAGAGVTVMHEFSRRSPELWRLGCRLGLLYYSYPPSVASAPAALQAGFENPKARSHAVRADEMDPAFRTWAIETAEAHARAWRSNRRLRYVLLNTEIETRVYPNLTPEAEARYRERLGFPRPPEADVPYVAFSPATSLERFPDRIVPDDAPLYRWFRFFYSEGGGAMNEIMSAQARAIEAIAPEITTFHDPVLRGPQFHGRWEHLDMLNHWTYVAQNPLDVVAFADELVCLAQHSGWRQKISQMIQAFAYSSRAMPENREQAPEYLRDAPFVAIPPDILSEASWLALSRPIDMIAFHGLNAVLETQEKESYRYTNPATLAALERVTRELIEPYGPALRRIKEQRGPRVALLLSAANTIFGRIPEGGGTRSLHHPLTAARFPVDVLYDEDLQDGALEAYQVLAIPQCRFLLQSVRQRIAEFQDRGGIVLLDQDARIAIPDALTLPATSTASAGAKQLELVPGEVLDLPDSSRSRLDADLRLTARALREMLMPLLDEPLYVDSPHPYVVLAARQSGDLTYIFAVNDRRTVGPYLGAYGAVLERGVPITASLQLRDTPGALYHALERRRLQTRARDDDPGCAVDITLEGGWGALLAACPEPLASPHVSAAESADARSLTVRSQVRYVSGDPVNGVVPLAFEVRSADGILSEFSRHAATGEDGSWETTVPIAVNDPGGLWTVRITELIGGNATTVFAQVTESGDDNAAVQRPVVERRLVWGFDEGVPEQAALRGRSRVVPAGRSGGCLESFAARTDEPEGLDLGQRPEFSPGGLFSAQVWVQPKPEMADADFSFLLDCNYFLNTRDDPRANAGYAFFLRKTADGQQPTLVLGFGDSTEMIKGKAFKPEAGVWHRFGFSYDGAGRVRILVDGRVVAQRTIPGSGPIAPAQFPLIVGGRVGSSHHGCAAFLDDLTVSTRSLPVTP